MLIGESVAPALMEVIWQAHEKRSQITDDNQDIGAGETLSGEIEAELKAAIPALTSLNIRHKKREDALVQIGAGPVTRTDA